MTTARIGGSHFCTSGHEAGRGALRCRLALYRLMRWLDGLEVALLSVMGHLKDIAVWVARAENVMVPQSCRTPPAFRTVITAWSLVLAPMVEVLTGSSLAAV